LRLKQFAEIRTGLVLSRKKGDTHDDEYYTYTMVTLKAFHQNGKLLSKNLDTYIAHEKLSDRYLTKTGDILIRLREPNHAVVITQNDAGLVVPSLVAHLKVDERANSEFLTYYLNSNSIQKKLQKEAKGTRISMIKTKDLSELELNLPTLEKQKQIVALLQLANQEVNLLESLKTEKINYKNILLDKIINEGNH